MGVGLRDGPRARLRLPVTWAPPAGWRRFYVTWNWNQLGAAEVVSEAGLIPAVSRDRGYLYSPYSVTMTLERLREAWWRLDCGRDTHPFPRKIRQAPLAVAAAPGSDHGLGVGEHLQCSG